MVNLFRILTLIVLELLGHIVVSSRPVIDERGQLGLEVLEEFNLQSLIVLLLLFCFLFIFLRAALGVFILLLLLIWNILNLMSLIRELSFRCFAQLFLGAHCAMGPLLVYFPPGSGIGLHL